MPGRFITKKKNSTGYMMGRVQFVWIVSRDMIFFVMIANYTVFKTKDKL